MVAAPAVFASHAMHFVLRSNLVQPVGMRLPIEVQVQLAAAMRVWLLHQPLEAVMQPSGVGAQWLLELVTQPLVAAQQVLVMLPVQQPLAPVAGAKGRCRGTPAPILALCWARSGQ